MEVFILLSGNEEEGYSVEGVYTTMVLARKAARSRLKVEDEEWKIETWDVDGECKAEEFLD